MDQGITGRFGFKHLLPISSKKVLGKLGGELVDCSKILPDVKASMRHEFNAEAGKIETSITASFKYLDITGMTIEHNAREYFLNSDHGFPRPDFGFRVSDSKAGTPKVDIPVGRYPVVIGGTLDTDAELLGFCLGLGLGLGTTSWNVYYEWHLPFASLPFHEPAHYTETMEYQDAVLRGFVRESPLGGWEEPGRSLDPTGRFPVENAGNQGDDDPVAEERRQKSGPHTEKQIAEDRDAPSAPIDHVEPEDPRGPGQRNTPSSDRRDRSDLPEDASEQRTGPRPILLDLDGYGIQITGLDRSNVFMDATGDGLENRTAWAAAGNAVLFYDPDGRSAITEMRQYVFTEWDPTAASDMDAFRAVFDTNGDGILDATDAEFGKFKLLVI